MNTARSMLAIPRRILLLVFSEETRVTNATFCLSMSVFNHTKCRPVSEVQLLVIEPPFGYECASTA